MSKIDTLILESFVVVAAVVFVATGGFSDPRDFAYDRPKATPIVAPTPTPTPRATLMLRATDDPLTIIVDENGEELEP
jgi:hypothetical protein